MNLKGFENLKTRLRYPQCETQQDRMIADKRKTLDKAVLYSYQGAKVQAVNSVDTFRALINPNRLQQDYDEKTISIGFESNFTVGTVFNWINTKTTWLIYLQDLTELAYFKGDMRKCSHEIFWEDLDGNLKSTYVCLIGPQERSIDSINKKNISIDIPNYTLQMMIPKNKDTLEYFNRYSKFYLQGYGDSSEKICWRVEAIDSISSPGILEVYANEYYSNVQEDNIEDGIVGDLITKPAIPEPSNDLIEGEIFILPQTEYVYTYTGNQKGAWSVISNNPIDYTIDGNTIKITWTKMHGGKFILKYETEEKAVQVNSLF